MLKMIIVDDEKVIRETICSIIDWEGLGIEVVGLCKSGLEGYDMLVDESPDIVLTDIKMPGMSGLEMIRRAAQFREQTEFVIMSGYGDYEFTHEAMRYGIQNYLLKPCSEQEIIEVIEQVKRRCYQRRARRDDRQQDFLMLKKLHESVMRNVLNELLRGCTDFSALESEYERFLSFSTVSYELCVFTGVPQAQAAETANALRAYHDAAAPGIPLHCMAAGESMYAFFESYDYDYTQLDAHLQKLADGITGCAARREPQADLKTLLTVLRALLDGDTGEAQLFSHGTFIKSAAAVQQQPKDELERERPDGFIDKITRYVNEHISDPDMTLKTISETFLYMNVDYVGKKFLKGTGRRFSAFLSEVRINKAKQLLESGELDSIGTVAEKVGCGNNPQYFSQLFKKHTGVTPTEYQKGLNKT